MTQTHHAAVRFRQSVASTSRLTPDPRCPNPEACNAVRGPLYELLQDLANPDLLPEVPEPAPSSSDLQLDWDAMGDEFEGRLAPSHTQASMASMAIVLEHWLGNSDIGGGYNLR